MYFLVGSLFFLFFLWGVFLLRRKNARGRLCGMDGQEKRNILDSLIRPFGYCYVPAQDVFSTVVDAPQRSFGYTALYDRYAPCFGMVFDAMPVYFDYEGKTWLIEFWKGQYGINLGGEVGIYRADSLVASVNRKKALFRSVDNSEMLQVSLRLTRNGQPCAHLYRKQWWMTAFCMGRYSEPEDLSLEAVLTFPDAEMLNAFADALEERGEAGLCVRGLQARVMFCFCASEKRPFFTELLRRYAQWKNRQTCRLFLWVTKPFQDSMDRLLFLYFCLPFFFRRIFRDARRGKCCKRSCRGCSVKNIFNGKGNHEDRM